MDGRCSVYAEQSHISIVMAGLVDFYLSTETNLFPIRGVMREEFDMALNFPHMRTRIQCCGPPGPGACAPQPSARIKRDYSQQEAPARTQTSFGEGNFLIGSPVATDLHINLLPNTCSTPKQTFTLTQSKSNNTKNYWK